MLGDDILYNDISLCGCCRHHECSRLDHIRNDSVCTSVESGNADDTDHVRTCALDIGAHTVQEIGHIDYVRLLGCIFNRCTAYRTGRSHHDIDGSTDRNDIHENVRTCHMMAAGQNRPVLNIDLCADRAETLQMLVDRSASDITSAGKRNFRLVILAQKRAEKIIGRADLSNIFILDRTVAYGRTVYFYRMPVYALNVRADPGNRLQENIDIIDIRKIFKCYGFIGHDRGGDDRERCILSPCDLNFSHQWISALNHILFHIKPASSYVNNPVSGTHCRNLSVNLTLCKCFLTDSAIVHHFGLLFISKLNTFFKDFL